MKINKPEIRFEKGEVRVSSIIETHGRNDILWFSVNKEYAEHITTERLDAFLIALLIPAMKRGEDIYLDGPISEKLFYNITNYYMAIICKTKKEAKKINITATSLDDGQLFPQGKGVVTGFSGGIDSLSLFVDHFNEYTPNGYRITHLIFNNVGSHGNKHADHLFLKRFNRVLSFCQEQELPLIKINSNMSDFYAEAFIETHSVRNVAAVLILQKLFKRYIYSSTYCYEDNFIEQTDGDIALTESMAHHLLSTESMECIVSGAQYSRPDKTRRVTELKASYNYLDVCFLEGTKQHNCSRCRKCLRTLLTLEIIGQLNNYSNIFDLEEYRKHRNQYIRQIFATPDIFDREIVNLIQQEKFHIPKRLLLSAFFLGKMKLLLGSRYESWRISSRIKPLINLLNKPRTVS